SPRRRRRRAGAANRRGSRARASRRADATRPNTALRLRLPPRVAPTIPAGPSDGHLERYAAAQAVADEHDGREAERGTKLRDALRVRLDRAALPGWRCAASPAARQVQVPGAQGCRGEAIPDRRPGLRRVAEAVDNDGGWSATAPIRGIEDLVVPNPYYVRNTSRS